MSEALTMGLADMGFVDTLVKLGIEYDYSKRKIYNLFEATGIKLSTSDKSEYLDNLKKIIWANYRFCLLGDEEPYKKLLGSSSSDLSTLEEFKSKYTPFFVSDYKWTEFNYKSMESKSNEFRLWYQALESQINSLGNLYTIDSITAKLFGSGLEFNQSDPEFIFEFIFTNIISKIFESESQLLDKQTRKNKAFSRYMIGQCMIFFKFNFIPESQKFFKRINMLVWDSPDSTNITSELIESVQNTYLEYLDILVRKNLISQDDKLTYAQVYPLFDPMYLTYDIDKTNQTIQSTHNKIFKEILSDTNPTLTPQTHLVKKIIELTGGYVEDDIFVIKPGVKLISYSSSSHPDNILTWVIAGCAIETSMELIAHKEARVARLTTSKTKAMNSPLYRIYGSIHGRPIDTRFQKEMIKQIQTIRSHWALSQASQSIPQEIFNMCNLGIKCTILTYSMSLSDLHKLFIGRAGIDGNESEVRDIIQMMITQAHEKFPEHIWSYSDYLTVSNSEKYTKLNEIQDLKLEPTKLTPTGSKLFKSLGIDISTPEYVQMAEFKSKITYMAFDSKTKSGINYIKKIVCELSHTSVLDGFQLVDNSKLKTCKELYLEKKLIL